MATPSLFLPLSEWDIEYPSYLIGDGEPHLRIGDAYDWFAIEFSGSLAKTREKSIAAIPSANYSYQVVAKVIDRQQRLVCSILD
jgi:hypothetical protein